MLFIEDDGTVKLTRGDTAKLNVSITDDITHEIYEIQPTDVLVMSIKKSIKDETACVTKSITGSSTFTILPSDTHNLSFGNYFYDVQITNANNEVYTVIGPCSFVLLKEVTY